MKQMSAMGVRRMMYPGRGPRGRIRTGGPDGQGGVVTSVSGAMPLVGPFAGLVAPPGMNMLVAPNLVAPPPQFGGLGVVSINSADMTAADGGAHAAYAHSAPELAAALMLSGASPANVAQQLAYYSAGTHLSCVPKVSERSHGRRV